MGFSQHIKANRVQATEWDAAVQDCIKIAVHMGAIVKPYKKTVMTICDCHGDPWEALTLLTAKGLEVDAKMTDDERYSFDLVYNTGMQDSNWEITVAAIMSRLAECSGVAFSSDGDEENKRLGRELKKVVLR